jgi:hypothetical protein
MNYNELFTNGHCPFDRESFENSDAYKYLNRIHDLVYSEEPVVNFLHVYKLNGELIIADVAFFADFDLTPVAGYVPRSMYKTEKDWIRPVPTAFGRKMHNEGFYVAEVESTYIDDYHRYNWELGSEIDPSSYGNSDNKYDCAYCVGTSGDSFVPGHARSTSIEVLSKANELFRGNKFLEGITYGNVTYQMMSRGYSMERHLDAEEGVAITNITYNAPPEGVIGRELVVGKWNFGEEFDVWMGNDPGSHIFNSNSSDCDIAMIPPRSGISVFINSINPAFYHGVNLMVSEGRVYSIINNFSHFTNNEFPYIIHNP